MGFASDLAFQREQIKRRRKSLADPYDVSGEDYDTMYPGTLRAEEEEAPPPAEPEYKPREKEPFEDVLTSAEEEADARQKALEDDARKKAASGVASIMVSGPLGAAKMVWDGIQTTNQSISNARRAKGRELTTEETLDAADPASHLGLGKDTKLMWAYKNPKGTLMGPGFGGKFNPMVGQGPGAFLALDKLIAGGKGTEIVMKALQRVNSGKGTDQLGRDYFRRAMQRAGLVDEEFNIRFGDGATWNIGKGGRLENYGTEDVTYKDNEYADKITQKGTHKIFQVDPTDPFAARLTSIADPLSRILAQYIPAGSNTYQSDIAGTFYNMMRETGGNPYLRMRGVYQKLGLDDAAKAHKALDAVTGLSDWEKIVMHGNIDRTYAGADPSDSGVNQKYGEGWIEPTHRDAFIADAQKRGATGSVLDDEGYVIEDNTPGFRYRKGRGVVW